MNILLALLCSYVLGSVPTAYLFGRLLKGIDIRRHGSGNVGATNAFRVLGKGPGTLVLLLDVIKGIIPLTILGDLFGIEAILPRILLGVAVVVGHNWTIFLQFRGGKGIATSLGVLIGLSIHFTLLRPVLAAALLTWLAVFLVSGFVSLASMAAAVVLPIAMLATHQPWELSLLGLIFCVFVLVRHRANLQRLRRGQESRVRLFSRRSA